MRVRRALLLLPMSLLLALPSPAPCEAPDNAPGTNGYVCRTIPDQSVAVVRPLGSPFSQGSQIRFLDDTGKVCATGTVKTSYSDLAYVALDNDVPVECLQKGFVAYSGTDENTAKMLCGFSRNLEMVEEKSPEGGRIVPKNVIAIQHGKKTKAPVYFRHYKHDMECNVCHHKQLDAPCNSCHPLLRRKAGTTEACLREVCTKCHKEHEDKTSECGWCHKDGPPPSK